MSVPSLENLWFLGSVGRLQGHLTLNIVKYSPLLPIDMPKIKIKRGKNIDFPSQTRMRFIPGVTPGSATPQAQAENDFVDGNILNLPYALSAVNYRGYQQTTTEGVPLIYRIKVNWYLQNEDGDPLTASIPSADFASILELRGCANTWQFKNAAVKWHAARKAMWKSTGIKRAELGSYTDAVRYAYRSSTEQYLNPIDGVGDRLTMGTWDISKFANENDTNFKLKLKGDFINEDGGTTTTTDLNMVGSYLQSRINQRADTNEESDDNPADSNFLESVFQLGRGAPEPVMEAVRDEVQDQGDVPPYETYTNPTDTQHSLSESHILTRATCGLGNTVATTIVDVPFGMAEVFTRYSLKDDTDVGSGSGCFDVELLNIYEMMG